ncbi:hypothetical protein GCM10022247_37060 [Allokutzneria multivorans]|uniref:Core-binding (CB) domain-containing protein n=2 Tax=Allokutzneria multivorans TaxID=1142134 RepID=A0ABP7SG86_9PSEU
MGATIVDMEDPSRSPVTTAGFVRLVSAWLATLASRHTRVRYSRQVGAFALWLLLHQRRHLLGARADDVVDYCRALSARRHDFGDEEFPVRCRNTVATAATALSSFYRYCAGVGLVVDNPVRQARAIDSVASYVPHPRRRPPELGAAALRAVVEQAHRDPWLGGALGASMVSLMLCLHWRPERITAATLRDIRRAGGIRDRARFVPLPPPVLGLISAWLAERPDTGHRQVFVHPVQPRPLAAIELTRLVARATHRAGLGRGITPIQLSRTAGALAAQGLPVALPTVEELRTTAAAPRQLALPEDADGYDPDWQDYGQQALIPLVSRER